jgi:hypothetical protein
MNRAQWFNSVSRHEPRPAVGGQFWVGVFWACVFDLAVGAAIWLYFVATP